MFTAMTNSVLHRFGRFATVLTIAAGALAATGLVSNAQEEANEGAGRQAYFEALKGKTVAYVPMAMTFDIAQEYAQQLEKQAKALGYNFTKRDPNWSIESAVQIVDQFIAEKPDVIVVHPGDARAFNRLIPKAAEAGVKMIFVNMRTERDGDLYIGADHYGNGRLKAQLAHEFCANSPTKKIAMIPGPTNNSVTIDEMNGMRDQIKEFGDMELVAEQSADADANKAKSIAATILKQHPDLCAIMGGWDGQDIGIPSAIEEAGLKGKVALITSGGGSKSTACDKVKEGFYDAFLSYDIGTQATVLNASVTAMFQSKTAAGSDPVAVYVPTLVITKDNVDSVNCWALEN